MAGSQDLTRLESELRIEDLTTLKRRRGNNRRDVTRNDRYLKDCASQGIEDLDTGAIEHHLEKIKADISVAELLQDAILSHLKEEEEEKEEDEHHVHHRKMLATRKGLSNQLTAAHVYEQSGLAKAIIDSYVVQPALTGYVMEAKLKELSTQLAGLQALAHPLKERPELSDTIQRLLKDLSTLWERYEEDNPDRKTSTVKDVKRSEMSKFDRLPRIELPSFNGENSEWHPYWEKFTNALNKDTTLTDVDRLSFLLMTMKSQEGKDIIDSHTRQGPDYDAAVRALKERYDQPRVTSRTIHRSFTEHAWKLTNEGIGKIITLIQRTVATLKECAVDTLETLYTVIAELHMPDEFFRYWTERTADSNKPPNTDRLIELLQQYRLRLQGRTDDTPARPRPSSIMSLPQQKKKPWKSATLHVQKERDCQICHDGSHPLYLCNTFKGLSVEERNSAASRLKVCTNCLSFIHFSRDCSSIRSCRFCGKKHHSLLHRQRSTTYSNENAAASLPVTNSTSAHVTPACNTVQGRARVFLGTCEVTVESGGRRQKARALLDGGSPISFITTKMTQRLKARKISEPTNVSGISQSEVPLCRYKVDLTLVPDRNHPPPTLRAVVIDTITGDLPGFYLKGVRDKPFLRGLDLADPNFDQPGAIDMLFGLDILDELLLNGRKASNDKMIYAQETIFGWSVRGKCLPETSSQNVHLCHHSSTSEPTTDELLVAFWKSEEPPADMDLESDEGRQALDHFARTHYRTEEGRYVVRLPMKDISLSLGCSRDQAVRRYRQNQHSLEKKGRYADFAKALMEYEGLNHAEPVPAEDLSRPATEAYYLPAHGVVKASSTSTKLRVVFDASARTTSGTALNDILLSGPNLYPLLTNVVLSFRMHPIGMSADISKMFREVGLHPEDRDLHRFLQSGPDGKLQDMRMTRVTFGVTSSPFLATQVLRQVAKDYQKQYPRASDIVRKQFYVDDCLTGASTVKEAAEIREELNELLATACMRL